MKYSHQEGEIRPLYSSVPKNQCFWPWAVVGSYPLAYFYLRCILFGDIILFAGKGHEDYQLIEGKKVHFVEREIIQEICREKQ